MPIPRASKPLSRKSHRSGLFYLMIWKLPVRNATRRECGTDILGVVIVVVLLAELVGLMRYLLTS